MLSFFRAVVKRHQAFKTMEKVITLEKNGSKVQALQLCQEIVNQFPRDDQFRFKMATLQESLGDEILLDEDKNFNKCRSKATP